MQYYTRLQESPSCATLAMLEVNPTKCVEVVPMEDRYGRTVAIRTVVADDIEPGDSVYVCAGDNPLFVASVIVLAHAHNVALASEFERHVGDGI